jgi:hypothetical protein
MHTRESEGVGSVSVHGRGQDARGQGGRGGGGSMQKTPIKKMGVRVRCGRGGGYVLVGAKRQRGPLGASEEEQRSEKRENRSSVVNGHTNRATAARIFFVAG